MKAGQLVPKKYRKKRFWVESVFDNEINWNRNGKLFIEITEDNYEACGITTEIIDGDVTDDTVGDSSIRFIRSTDSAKD